MIYKMALKPAFDFLFALILLVVLSPLFLLITVILALTNKGKVYFIQERPGKDGHLFRLVKFRTMNNETDDNGVPLPDHQRMTQTGKLMRLLSIDELPQLLNILKGEMSFVGPRPLLTKYLPLYGSSQARRHDVRPGITGWAQINGRNAISWSKKLEYDVWYVDNLTFLLDLKIILRTIFIVISRQGINSSAKFTMEAFNGNN